MIWVDYCILVIVFASTLVGIIRGFTRETLSLLTWVFTLLLAYIFGDLLAERLDGLISVPSIRMAAAYGALFLGGLVSGAIVTHLLAGAVRQTPFAGPDRTLGGGFGLIRGCVIIVLLVFFGAMTPMPQDRWWQESIFISRFAHAAAWLQAHMPEGWQQQIDLVEDNA